MYDLLDRLSIVEASAFVAAPLAAMTLAQLGAEVIRVDMIGGGLDYNRWPLSKETGRSLYWAGLNKGKKSVAVNLRDPRGRELVQTLATRPGEDTGILLTNFAGLPWLSQEVLEEKRADAISVAVKGSPDGSPAVDYTINCAVGYPHLTGPDTTPVNNVLPAWDVGCGLHAALAIVASVDRRKRTGKGGRAEVALSDIAMAMVGNMGQIGEVQRNGVDRGPIGNDLYGAFGRDFGTSDGRRVMISAITVKQWKGLCRVAGIEQTVAGLETALAADFSDEGQRFEWRKVLFALIEKWCGSHSLDAVGAALTEAGVTWGPYQTVGQMLADDWRASEKNPLFQTVNHPEVGEVLTPGSPIDFRSLERLPVAPAPALGQHTDQVLAEVLGLDSGAIGKLHDDGIVAGPAA
ncbi:CoA transferase [Thalassobaculum sp. OXR-137]|uniref:CoA transferase n=1 Tax=Thalassobaculum sp. OXR-137 TaxID=3100173 RepID=UPI002AC91D50|nr:CoA transferase [Thalassobaculum sp. OXR-137]WPZ36387.1 CoA transferase [Thalassobaculum sp. OXR-137]